MVDLKISGKQKTIAYIKAGIGTIAIAVIGGFSEPFLEWLILDSGYSITWINYLNKIYQAIAMVVTFWVIMILGTMDKSDMKDVKDKMKETNEMSREMSEASRDTEGNAYIEERKAEFEGRTSTDKTYEVNDGTTDIEIYEEVVDDTAIEPAPVEPEAPVVPEPEPEVDTE